MSNFVKQFLTGYYSKIEKYIEGALLNNMQKSQKNATEKLDFYNKTKDNFLSNISSEALYKKFREANYKMIKNSYKETSDELLTSQHFDSNFSGTTAVSLLLIGDKIICFNAGDSRAILVTETKNSK